MRMGTHDHANVAATLYFTQSETLCQNYNIWFFFTEWRILNSKMSIRLYRKIDTKINYINSFEFVYNSSDSQARGSNHPWVTSSLKCLNGSPPSIGILPHTDADVFTEMHFYSRNYPSLRTIRALIASQSSFEK